MKCDSIIFSGHAITRMFDRGLSKADVISTIHSGEIIFDYPDDEPYPSKLLLGMARNIPVHVVVAHDKKDYACYVITAYIPSSKLWHIGFKTRKQQ
ncbi:MAG: DUF4258 domain-containing protein [Gammaproteobacteria bacterium]|nr:DUF4258 domain-containing protein [Gammaproteobacteria bacterium]